MTVVPRRMQWQPRACANRLLGPQLQPAGILRPSQPRYLYVNAAMHIRTTTKSSTIHQNKSLLLQKNTQYFLMMRHYCLCIYYESTLTRLHLTVSIPGIWVSRNNNVKPFWVLLQQKMMEVAVCNGNIRTCKAPVRTPPATNQHSVFCRSAALPATQPRVSRH